MEKAFLSIQVEHENLTSKIAGLGFRPVFALAGKKNFNTVIIRLDDGNGVEVSASDNPRVFNIPVGEHTLYVSDKNASSKSSARTIGSKNVLKSLGDVFISSASGDSLWNTGATIVEAIGTALNETNQHTNELIAHATFTVKAGETVRFTCKPTAKGIVELTRL